MCPPKEKVVILFLFLLLFSSCSTEERDGYYDVEYAGIGTPYQPIFTRQFFTAFKKFPSEYFIQSSAICGDYWFGIGCDYPGGVSNSDKQNFIVVCNLKSSQYLTTLWVDTGDLVVPHANVSCFGNEVLDGSPFPPLYISQWDYNGERGVVVVKIVVRNGNYSCETVQTIIPDIKDKERFGRGSTDWIVDTDNCKLYSLAYYIPGSSAIVENNKECICVFELPKIGDGKNIVLTDDDIVENYELEMFNYSQDKCYYNGNIFVSSGAPERPEWLKIRCIDLAKKEISSIMDLSKWGSEPEGMDIYDGGLLMNYGGREQYMLRLRR